MLCFLRIDTSFLLLTVLLVASLSVLDGHASPMLQETLLNALPRDLAERIVDNDQTLQRIEIQPASQQLIYPEHPLTPQQEHHIKMTHQCLARAPHDQISPQVLSKPFLYLFTTRDNNEHIVTGHCHDLSTLFRIECPEEAGSPALVTVYGDDSDTPHADDNTPRQAWLLTIGHPRKQHSPPHPRSLLFALIPRAFMQIRFYLAESRAQKIHQLANAWQSSQQEFQDVLSLLADWRHIPGTADTKHGYLAEKVEVAARNARALAMGKSRIARAESTLNHPIDFYLNHQPIQEKCYQSATASLKAMSEHWQNYKGDTRFESGRYMIPQDQYQQLKKALTGTKQTARKVQTDKFLELTGANTLDDIVIPASVTYKELHKGNIQSTVAKLENEYRQLNEQAHQQLLRNMTIRSLLTGAMTGGGFEALHTLAEHYFNRPPRSDSSPLYRIAGKALYGSLASSGTFLLHVNTSLPAPACGTIINSSLRILHDAGQRVFDQQEEDFTSRALYITGEEAFAGLGSTIFNGQFAGQVAGALSGSILWYWLTSDST